MNWVETLDQLKSQLKNNGFTDSYQRILDAQMLLGTPGEMYLEVMTVLLEWKKNNTKEYKLVYKEIEELLEFGRSLNYFSP